MVSKSKEGMQARTIRITLVNGTVINGQANINRDPDHDRLSDLVGNHKESFLVIYNATLYENSLDNPVKHKTMFINKTNILWVSPCRFLHLAT